MGPAWLPFPLPSIGSCESVFGGGMWLEVAQDTELFDLSREAAEEQESGQRRERRKQTAAPSCASLCCSHSSWKPAKCGS